jgi:hypothetical protein
MPNISSARFALATAIVLCVVALSQTASAAPSNRAGADMRVGAQRSFWVIGSSDAEFDRLNATLVYDGRFSRIWIDNRDTATIDPAMLRELERGLDTATPVGSRNSAMGIIENEQQVFGSSPARFKVGGKDDFLLFDIPNTAGDGLTLLGYFHTKDQYSRDEVPSSNELNMLYIDSREGMKSVKRLLSTIAHEYQHLIHFGRNPQSERFYTEAMSEFATVLTGFRLSNADYMANTNTPMFRWSDQSAEASQVDYQRGMMLMRYLDEQYGERFIDTLVGTLGTGVVRFGEALAMLGLGGQSQWREVLTRFAVANYLQGEGQGAYGYTSTDTWHARRARPAVVDVATVPAAYRPTRASLQPFGTTYFQYDMPLSLPIAVDANPGYRVVAIRFGAEQQVSVAELAPGQQYDLGDREGGIERVVLAFVSLSDRPQLVSMGAPASATSVSMR